MADDQTDRRQFMKVASLVAGLGATSGVAAAGRVGSGSGDDEPLDDRAAELDTLAESGLVTVESDDSFEATVDAIENRIDQSPLTLMTTVDHAANAESVDEDLPPTTLFIFGNPAIGTQLMQESRSVAIDLPQKLVVWCADGAVNVTYNDPTYLAERHGIEGMEQVLSKISNALQMLATGGGDGSDENDDSA
ncbi:DUF302 domain-containing protein [Haloarchaeobius sp. DFWS5]|uniref:DUF302 domain-containing protein n=1 Tax=Haloarchaeobius sp. DFWS5 TaxID=3446114 RepID=UPI003EBD9E53